MTLAYPISRAERARISWSMFRGESIEVWDRVAAHGMTAVLVERLTPVPKVLRGKMTYECGVRCSRVD